MRFDYRTKGVCSRVIHVEVEDGIVREVVFEGGCPGNAQGVSRLVRGRPVAEVIDLLQGIKCGFKPTSCPDQLARALMENADQAAPE